MWSTIWKFIKTLLSKVSLRTWIEIIVGVGLALALLGYVKSYNKAKSELNTAQNNNAAYQAQLESAENNLIQFQFSIDQLMYFNDSISNKLKQAIKESGIKDKKIKELQYQLTHFERTDTIRLTDTIFCEPEFMLDTVVGDEWMNTLLHLEYPSTIGVKSTAVSDKKVIIHSEREYVDPPAKFFLCRWFQKKHTVTRVEIEEENPNIKSTQNVFIQISE